MFYTSFLLMCSVYLFVLILWRHSLNHASLLNDSFVSCRHFISTNATSTFHSIVSSYPGDLAIVSIQVPGCNTSCLQINSYWFNSVSYKKCKVSPSIHSNIQKTVSKIHFLHAVPKSRFQQRGVQMENGAEITCRSNHRFTCSQWEGISFQHIW